MRVDEGYHGNHLIFTPMGGSGCYSSVGRDQTGKGQYVNLGSPACLAIGTIIHETLHSLGAVHEQSRHDRDHYISILWDNIEPGREANFRKKISETFNTWNTPFDYQSIMLYPSDAFGIDDGLGGTKTTIQPLKQGVEIRGSDAKTELSAVDAVELARTYQPKTGDMCFTLNTLVSYANQLDLMRLRNSPGGCPRHSTSLSHGCYIFLTGLYTWSGAKPLSLSLSLSLSLPLSLPD